MYLAAARVSDPNTVIDHKLYWAAAANLDEARYLTAVLNSTTLLDLVRPLQARGEHNPRDFDKYVFQMLIPLYSPDNPICAELAELARRAEELAAAVELPAVSFQTQRRRIREELDAHGIAKDIDIQVTTLLTPTAL